LLKDKFRIIIYIQPLSIYYERTRVCRFYKGKYTSKLFLIIGSNGSIQEIKCQSSSQFIKHLNFIKEKINKEEIRYMDLD